MSYAWWGIGYMGYERIHLDKKYRYAYLLATDRKYMPGVNATLNALEFYGFSIDVYVLTIRNWLEEEYKQQWPDNVNFITMDLSFADQIKGTRGKLADKWFLRFGTLDFAIQVLLKYYPLVVIEDADVVPLDNFMEWFEIIESSGELAVSTIEFGINELDFSGLKKDWPYPGGWKVPYANCPLFIGPSHVDVLKKDIEYQGWKDCQLSVMNGLNYAMRDCNIAPMALPGQVWNCANPSEFQLIWKDQHLYLGRSSTRIKLLHRAYWNATLCHNYLARHKPEQPQPLGRNKQIFNRIHNFFNKDCRVKWEEGVEVWNGI